MAELKTLEKHLLNFQIPLTIEEKRELTLASADVHNAIMHKVPVQKCCASCEHCVLYEGQHCCSARKMAPIPFEVENRTGGCSMWYEKDYIPF